MTNVPPPAGAHLNVNDEDSDAEDIGPPLASTDSNGEDGDDSDSHAEAEVPATVAPAARRYPRRHRQPPDRLTA